MQGYTASAVYTAENCQADCFFGKLWQISWSSDPASYTLGYVLYNACKFINLPEDKKTDMVTKQLLVLYVSSQIANDYRK